MNAGKTEFLEGPIETVSALEVINKSEIDIQISTAKKYPRLIKKFKDEALAMATLDEETASSCFYVLKRKNADGTPNNIEGPSIRLAEIIGSAWGNLRYGARVISIDDKFVTAQGVCHDLEKNNSANVEVRRRITTKSGSRYGDDMIGVTANAACSIALRNAIFKIVPFTYAKDIYEQAKKTAIGDAKTLSSKRESMIQYFGKMGVSKDKIFASLDIKSVDEIGLDQLATLKGFATAIKDGDSTIEQVFEKQAQETSSGASKLNEKMQETATQQKEAAAPTETAAQGTLIPETQLGEDVPTDDAVLDLRLAIKELLTKNFTPNVVGSKLTTLSKRPKSGGGHEYLTTKTLEECSDVEWLQLTYANLSSK